MDEYISKKYIINKCREHRDFYVSQFGSYSALPKIYKTFCDAYTDCINDVLSAESADVQPLSVVAEHIKKRLYETAFNTTEEKARNAIADMAGRIDFWINELRDGDAE